jgi:hypothetical protein
MTLRDTLLRTAEAGLYQPKWSDQIVDEFTHALVRQGLVSGEQAARLRRTLEATFEDAFVHRERYRPLIAAMTNQPKDRHVLAATVAGGAEVIVTFNLKDFGGLALSPYAMEARSPDEFLSSLFDLDPTMMTQIVVEQARDLQKPPISVAELIRSLERHAPGFAERVRRELERTG